MAPFLGEIGGDLRAAFDEVERLRKEFLISRAAVARAAGLSESTYNRLVSDRARTPHRKSLLALRRAVVQLAAEAA